MRKAFYGALVVVATLAIPAVLPDRADAQFFVRGRGFAVGVGYPTYYGGYSRGYYGGYPGYYGGYYGRPYYNNWYGSGYYGPRYYGGGYRYWR